MIASRRTLATTSALAIALGAEKLMVLTDVEGLYRDWPDSDDVIQEIGPEALAVLATIERDGLLARAVEVRVGVCRQSDPRSSGRVLLAEAIEAVEDAGEHHGEVARRDGRSLFGGPAGGAWIQSDGAELP